MMSSLCGHKLFWETIRAFQYSQAAAVKTKRKKIDDSSADNVTL